MTRATVKKKAPKKGPRNRTYPDKSKVKGTKAQRKKIAKGMKAQAEDRAKNAGAPSTYDKDFARQAKELCLRGATDADLANFFGVTTVTIWNWSTRHQEFFNALHVGKDAADARVERSMYENAIGYEVVKDELVVYKGKVKKYQVHTKLPPNDRAGKFWLINRKPLDWRERTETAFDPDKPLKVIVEGGLPK
jgi:hypothetical protein